MSLNLKCYKCGEEYPATEMRYVDTKKMVCRHCLDRNKDVKKGKISEDERKKPIRALVEEEEQEKVVSYNCTACKYSFKRKESVNVTTCPYCGKSGKVEMQKKNAASSIIKDSMDKRYDF
jgi:DNA-directed RNA polymerase subunit RPC12/RpoP